MKMVRGDQTEILRNKRTFGGTPRFPLHADRLAQLVEHRTTVREGL